MSHRDILKKLPYLYFFECGLSTREKIFEADMLCRIFRPIDWYHSLVPKKNFSGVIQDLGPFLESPFLPITRKRLIFEIWFRSWAPIFFQFPIRWPIHFFGGLTFFENFPYYCNSVPPFFWIWRGQANLCFGKKTLLIVNFTFRMWRIKWRMPKCKWRKEWMAATAMLRPEEIYLLWRCFY